MPESYEWEIQSNSIPGWPQGPKVIAETAILMDLDTGEILYAKGIDEKRAPASTTKIMTAMLAIEKVPLDTQITFTDEVNNIEPDSTHIGIKPGETLTMEQSLYGILLASANEVSSGVAEYIGGTVPAFVDMMNQRIEELGCNESHFANPSGLNDDTQRTTAYDMAIIARACFQNPTVLEIASARTSSIPATANNPNGRTFSIEHKMLLSDDSNYYPDAIAGKTGWTSQAGQTLVTYARREGRGQIAVTLMSTQKTHYSDTKTILDFCFAKFKNVNIADNETEYVTGSAPVTIGAETYNPSELSIDSGAVITIPNDAQFTDADKTLETDLPEGHPQEAVARLVYTYNERRVGDAWIYSSRAQAVNATPSEPGGDTPPESRPAEDGQEGNTGFTLPRAVLIGGGAVLVLALLAGGGVFWFKRRQAAERERQRILREKRRQRLADIGYTEEDFERLLDERRKQHDMR